MLSAHALLSNLNQMAASQLVHPSIVRLQRVVAFLYAATCCGSKKFVHTRISNSKTMQVKPAKSILIQQCFHNKNKHSKQITKCPNIAQCFAVPLCRNQETTFIPTGSSVNRTISSTPCLQRGCFKSSHQRAKHPRLRRFNESSTSYSRPVQHVELANSANRTTLNPHCRSAFQRSFASSQPGHPIKHLLLTQENARRTCYAVKSQSNGSKSASRSIYRQASASGCFYRCSHPISAAACSGSKKLAHTQMSNKQTQQKPSNL